MKQLLIIILLSISVAGFSQGNWTLSGAKNRWGNGIGFSTKDTASYTNGSDSVLLVVGLDGQLHFKYKTFWNTLASTGFLTPYKLVSDTFFTNGYTTRARTKQYGDSIAAVKIGLTSLSASGGALAYSNTSGIFSLAQANTSVSGFLSSTDWNTFNGKQTALSGTGYSKFSGASVSYISTIPATDGGTGYTSLSALAGDAAFTGKYLALTGGTLTGGLTGTTGNFSSSVTSTSFIGGSFSGTTGNFSSTLSSSVNASINGIYIGAGGNANNQSTAIGVSALAAQSTFGGTYSNTAVGYYALSATTGSYNTAVGNLAATNLTTSSRGTFIGYGTGSNVQAQANDNTFIGYVAGGQTTGSSNTIIGSNAGNVGSGTLYYQTTLIGDSTRLTGNFNNSTALGYQAVITASNQMVFGNSSVTANVFNGSVTGGAASFTTGAFSGLITATGGINLGNTTLSNYTEGTFVATGNNITYTLSTLYYTRVGRIVHITGRVTFPTTADTNPAQVLGLPFTSNAADGARAGFTPWTNYTIPIQAIIANADTYISFSSAASGGAAVTNVTLSGKTIYLDFFYTL